MNAPRHVRQGGLSLVELMIALVIGMLIVTSVATVWISNQHTYRYEEDLSRIQENGRFAIETLAYDLRMAGHFGCSDDMSSIVSQLGTVTAGSLQDLSNVIEGRERGDSDWQDTDTAWLPSGSTAIDDDDIAPGTDAITLRYVSSENFRLTASMGSLTDVITVESAPDYKDGQLVAVTDCAGGNVFEVGADTESALTITHDTALSKVYEGHSTRELSFVQAYVPVRYFIGTNGAGVRVLMRQTLNSSGATVTEELLEGVENLQFLYGEDTAGDEAVDLYVSAPTVTNWPNVRTVRVAVLVAALAEYGADRDTNSYQLLDETIPAPNDRRRRREFTATVQVRNNR